MVAGAAGQVQAVAQVAAARVALRPVEASAVALAEVEVETPVVVRAERPAVAGLEVQLVDREQSAAVGPAAQLAAQVGVEVEPRARVVVPVAVRWARVILRLAVEVIAVEAEAELLAAAGRLADQEVLAPQGVPGREAHLLRL